MDVISEAKNIEGGFPLIPVSPDAEPVTAHELHEREYVQTYLQFIMSYFFKRVWSWMSISEWTLVAM